MSFFNIDLPYGIKAEFYNESDGRYLRVITKKIIMTSRISEDKSMIKQEDLKSLIIDRDEILANNLTDCAKKNLLEPTGENALTWNLLRTIAITNRWDVLFSSTDLLTKKPMIEGLDYSDLKLRQNYFWNIMPSTGYFNLKHLWLSIQGLVPSELMFLVEPDYYAVFKEFGLLVESKLKSGFSGCRLKERGCDKNHHCYLSSFFYQKTFSFGNKDSNDCSYFHQLLNNFYVGSFLTTEYRIRGYININILNEKSRYYNENLKKIEEFCVKTDPTTYESQFRHYQIKTTSWQKIRENLKKLINKKDKRQARLLYYLYKHPEL
jgi:hypothetical protein